MKRTKCLLLKDCGTLDMTIFMENTPRETPWWPCFKKITTIFKLIQDIIRTNVLTKFYEDWTINISFKEKNAPSIGSHIFQPTGTILELIQYIIVTILLTKFHEDQTINVAPRVLTRKNAPPPCVHVFQATGSIFKLIQDINVLTRKNAQPPGGHVFQPTGTNFNIVQDFISTNLLTKFYGDRKINMASGVLTRQMLTPHDA
ncbi:hypothetical protein DPMN_079961 [Dreissena polymorpha]|uniref:Uncharacterized protein n=1 Tax=Dreissena polymorpha TaxID=45954 RepID=A0A9D3YU34_DREPO|nr:hypothetical protein DPMN_079961 [Dreissena polymorpha]